MTNRPLRRSLGLSGSTIAMLAGGHVAPALAQDAPASAMPTAGSVVSGNVALPSPVFGNQTVTQTSERAVINWGSFNVGTGQTLTFAQPSVNSATLNRVTGDTTSTIAGTVNATGSVFLVNPNGIQITASGAVNVGRGFVASTLDINDADFMSGQGTFTGNGGLVSNSGTITVTGSGGFVGLLGGQVNHTGLIAAPAGQVTIGAVTKATLDLNGGGFLSIALPDAARVNADGTAALVSTADAQNAVRNIVNLPGSVAAQSAAGNNGDVTLSGTVDVSSDSGNAGTIMAIGNAMTAKGTLLARATGTSGDGGFIETSGNTVDFAGLTVKSAASNGKLGTWLIDPIDITVDAAAAATISSALEDNNVALLTTADSASGPGVQTPGSGDINIDSAITWTGPGELSLTAIGAINIDAPITGNNGYLVLSSGLVDANSAVSVGNFWLKSGSWVQNSATLPSFNVVNNFVIGSRSVPAYFTRVLGGNGSAGTPYQVADIYGLQGMASAPAAHILLANDIDASGTGSWNYGYGFDPLGDLSGSFGSFTGNFDGQNHTITGLTINGGSSPYTGLFGSVENATISNVDLANVQIVGTIYTGALFGSAVNTTIDNVSTSGAVSGGVAVGGLGGYMSGGTVSNASSSASAYGTQSSYSHGTGGLLGSSFNSTISDSYATGLVEASESRYVGGLVGISGSVIVDSYATGNVSTNADGGYAGGLVGHNGHIIRDSYATGSVSVHQGEGSLAGGLTGTNNATIERSYASGNVDNFGGGSAGGLSGMNYGIIADAYATGAVTRSDIGGSYAHSGGLVGNNYGSIDRTYATGVVAWDGNNPGGLVGYSEGGLYNSFWLNSSADDNGYGQALTASEMRDPAFFQGSGWDIANTGGSTSIWRIYEGQTAPLLRSLLTPLNVTANSATVTYNGSAQMVTGYTPSISGATLQGTAVYSGGTGTDAGKYDHGVSGLYSGQQGYDITFVTGALNINQAMLTAITYSIADATSTFGTLATLGAVTLSGLASVDIGNVGGTVGLFSGGTQVAHSATLNAGTYAQRVTGLTGSAASNYTIASSGNTDGILVVNKLALTGTIAESSSTYGSALAPGAAIFTNMVAGHEVTGNVSIDTTGVLSSSGHLKTGFYNGGYPGGQFVSSLNGASAGNYTFDNVVGAYYVGQKVIGASIASASSIYGSEFIRGSVTLTGLIDGDDVQAGEMELDTEGLTSSSGHLRVGTHTEVQRLLSLAGTDSENYAFNSVLGGDYMVEKLALGGEISPGSSTYGDMLISGIANLSGVISGDDVFAGSVDINTSGNISGSGNLRAGNYTGIQSLTSLAGIDADNYSFANVLGDYTVGKRDLTGMIFDGFGQYGSTFYNGPVYLQTLSGDHVAPEVTIDTAGRTSSSGNLRAGYHSGIQSVSAIYGLDADNYSLGSITGNVYVQKALLEGNVLIGYSVYGQEFDHPLVDFFVTPGDQVFAENVTVNTDGNTSSSGHLRAGYYHGIRSVTSVGGADAENYEYLPGSIVGDYFVEQAQLTGSIATGSSVYGDTLTPGELTLNGIFGGDDVSAGSISINLDGNTSSSGNLRAGTHANIQSLSSLNGSDAGNYSFSSVLGDYTVTKKGIDAFHGGGTIVYGDDIPLMISSLPDLVEGDFVFGTGLVNTTGLLSSSGNLRAGSHNIIETALDGSDAANYTVVNGPGLFTVLPRPLFGMIGDGTSTYGDELVSPEVSLLGAIGGDIVNAQTTINTSGLLSGSGHLRAGTHDGIVSVSGLTGLDGGNYIVIGGSGNYTVAKRAINDGYFSVGTSEYGAGFQIGPVSIDTMFGDDVIANIAIDTIGRTSTGGYLRAGFHSDILSVSSLGGADANNYELGKITGDYFVSQRYLEGYIADSSSVYGQALQPGAVNLFSLIGDQVFADVSIDTTGNVSSSGHLKAGQYSGIQTAGTISGADADNYYLGSISSANYIVEKAQLTGTIETGSSIYGDTLAPGNVTLDGVVFGDMLHAGSVAIDTAGATSSSGHLRAGNYNGIQSISELFGPDADNYSLAKVVGDYTVTQKDLDGFIHEASSVYGDEINASLVTLYNLIQGDSVTAETSFINADHLYSSSGHLVAGSHSIVRVSALSGADSENYRYTGNDGVYTVTQRAIGGSISAASSIYGDDLIASNVSLTGLVDGDAVLAQTSINTTNLLSGAGKLKAGNHTGIVTVAALTGDDSRNYIYQGDAGDYLVEKRALTNGFIGTGVSTYGQPFDVGPAFLDTLSGDQVTGNVVITDIAGSISTSGNLRAGVYSDKQLVKSIDGADADNYELGRITGNYVVQKALLNGFILPGASFYGDELVAGPSFLFTVPGDEVFGEVAINTSGLTSSSGHLRAGYYTDIQSISSIGGADADNYDLGVVTGDWTVTPRLISASIEAGSSVYGDVLAPGAATLSGLIDGDQVDPANVIIDTSGLLSSSGNLRAGTHTGIQQLGKLSGLDAANYTTVPLFGDFTPVTADYTVTAKVLDATIAAGSSVYGEALAPGAATLNGVVDGDNVLAGNVTIDTTGFTSTSGFLIAGLHEGIQRLADLAGADAGNYSFAGATGDYTVEKREVGGSIEAASSVYGAGRLTPGVATLTGVLADDIVTGNVGVNSLVSLSSSGRLNAGNYQGIQYITWLGGADGGNYTAPSIRGDYTITPRVLTTSIQTRSAVYGTPFSPPDVSLFGVITGDNVSTEVTINDSGLRSSSGNIIAGKHVGFVLASSTLSGIDAGNYSFAGAAGDYIVTPRALTGTISDATAIYGDIITMGELTLTGLVDGDSITTYGASISAPSGFYSTSGHLRAGSHRNVQRVSNQLFGADANNYTFRGATGNITITPRAITGSLETGTSVYGQRLTPGKLTLTGLLDGDLVSGPVAQVDVSGNTSASGFLNAGSYTGIVSVGSNLGGRDRANYSFAGVTGDYEVTQANLNITYTARGAFRQYGAADPAFTGFTSATGLARGETLADVTTGTASFGTDATASTNVGRAGIFGSGLSANSGNYVFNFVQAANNSTALNISQATLNIVAAPLSRRYGSENPLLAYTLTGLVNGDTLSGALATTATQTSNVGRYAITLGTLSAGSNYRIRFNGSLLNVTAATLTYNADPVSRLFGKPNPPLTGTVTGFVLDDTLASATTGTLRFSPGTNGVLTPGSYAINGGGLIANNRNYTFVQAAENATALTVTKP